MHVVKKRIMKDEMNFRIPDVTGKIVGATEMTTAGGVILLGYREKSEYRGCCRRRSRYPVPVLEECRNPNTISLSGH